jgi:hypothetical protein
MRTSTEPRARHLRACLRRRARRRRTPRYARREVAADDVDARAVRRRGPRGQRARSRIDVDADHARRPRREQRGDVGRHDAAAGPDLDDGRVVQGPQGRPLGEEGVEEEERVLGRFVDRVPVGERRVVQRRHEAVERGVGRVQL